MTAMQRSTDRPPPRDDTALAAAFLEGRREAVDQVRQWIAPVVRHRAWGFATPEDVEQATLLGLLVALRAGRFDGTDLRALARRIARNICVSCYRRHLVRRGTVELESVTLEPATAAPDGPVLRELTLAEILDRLDAPCRELIRMAYTEDLSAGEIGERLSASAGAVRVRLHRCLEKARRLVQEEREALARWAGVRSPGEG